MKRAVREGSLLFSSVSQGYNIRYPFKGSVNAEPFLFDKNKQI